MEAAAKAAQEAQTERDQAVTKLENMETEVKRLRADLGTTKEALEKLSRQAKKDKDELGAETKVTEELRQDLKSLRDQHTKALAQLDEIKTASEAKDRQIAANGEDVRRAKKKSKRSMLSWSSSLGSAMSRCATSTPSAVTPITCARS